MNSRLSLEEFADALSVMELPAGDQGALWAARPIGPQRAVPFLNVNGKTMKLTASRSTRAAPGSWWAFRLDHSVEIRSLEVGLRKQLRQRLAQEGAKALVQIFAGQGPGAKGLGGGIDDALEASEQVFLDHDNNYRCCWPELSERPVSFAAGLRVFFSILGRCGSSLVMGPPVSCCGGSVAATAEAGWAGDLSAPLGLQDEGGRSLAGKRKLHEPSDEEGNWKRGPLCGKRCT